MQRSNDSNPSARIFEPLKYGSLTIAEDESSFIVQQSQLELSQVRGVMALFCIGLVCLFCWTLSTIFPLWLCIAPLPPVCFYAIRGASKTYPQPHHYFAVDKQSEQIEMPPKTGIVPLVLAREETYAFYVWLTYSTEHEEAIFHIDRNDKKTVLFEDHGYGDTAKQIALFLGNLWDKPVMLRDENGQFSSLSHKK